MLSLLFTIGILFVSTFIRSATGFGDALLAMPLLVLTVGLQTATPLVAFVASTISLTILVREWRTLELRGMWRLIFSTFIGIPLGLVLLNFAPEKLAKAILGTLLILYGLYGLSGLSLPQIRDEKLAGIFGFIAGVLGGAYNTNGPPIVIYGTLRRWSPDYFRVNLQGYFFLTNWLIIVGHGLAGLWTSQVLQLYVYSLPAVVTGILIGEMVNKRIPKAMFSRLVYILLVVIGVLFVV